MKLPAPVARVSGWLWRPNVAIGLALLACTALGACLRAHGIGFGHWPLPKEPKDSVISRFIRGQNDWRHPDEDQIVYRVSALSLRKPRQLDPDFFAYGSLPLYMYRAVYERQLARWEEAKESQVNRPRPDTYFIGRVISCLFGIATLPLVFLLGRSWFGWKEGLLAAALLSVCVFHIQASHFLAVDVMLQFLIGCTLFFMGKICLKGRFRDYVAAGILVGVSLATKFNAIYLIPMMGIAHLGHIILSKQLITRRALKAWISFGVGMALAGTFFFLGQPYAFLRSKGTPPVQPSPSSSSGITAKVAALLRPDRILNPKFLAHIREESEKARNLNRRPVPFMIQYEKTPAYLYQARNWCGAAMGPFLGFSAIAGVILMTLDRKRRREPLVILFLIWILIYFGTTGRMHAKFLRHALPIYSHLCLAAGYLLVRISPLLGRLLRRPGRLPLGLLSAAVFCPTLFYAVAFESIYSKRNTRMVAHDWMAEHLRMGKTRLVVEERGWDPIIFPGSINGGQESVVRSMDLNIDDNVNKVREMAEKLAWGNWLLIGTKRQMGSLTNVPERYPFTTTYYKLLFSGLLGYDLAHGVSSYPSFMGLTFRDDLADESFMVYDHPKLLFFARTREVSGEEILRLLESPPEEVERMDINELLIAPPTGWVAPEGLVPVETAPSPAQPGEGPVPADGPPRSMFEGGQGAAPGQFNEPRDLAVSSTGEVYVADFRNSRIQVFDGEGRFLRKWGSSGSEPGQFTDLSSVMVHSSGLVYVTDTFNHRVQIFSQTGEFKGFLAPSQGEGFIAPSGIVEGPQGELFIASTANCFIFRFDASGKHLSTWGGVGKDPGKLDRPVGLAVDADGNILVADCLNLRIQWFTPEGRPVRSVQMPLWAGEGHIEPYLEVDPKGRVWATDTRHNRILVLDAATGEAVQSYDGGNYRLPTGLARLGENMLVTDTWNHRIVKLPIPE